MTLLKTEGIELTCTLCSRVYVYIRGKGHNITKCNSCKTNIKRFNIKKKLVEFMGGKCLLCGYCKSTKALQFHHLDPSKKDFQIGGNHSRTWKSIENEIWKCVMICANCHAEVHEGSTKIPESIYKDNSDKTNKHTADTQSMEFKAKLRESLLTPCESCGKPKHPDRRFCSYSCIRSASRWNFLDLIELRKTKSIEEIAKDMGCSGSFVYRKLNRQRKKLQALSSSGT